MTQIIEKSEENAPRSKNFRVLSSASHIPWECLPHLNKQIATNKSYTHTLQ
jgi:hypothetical protein